VGRISGSGEGQAGNDEDNMEKRKGLPHEGPFLTNGYGKKRGDKRDMVEKSI